MELCQTVFGSSVNSPDSAVFLLFSGTGQEFLLPQAGMPDLGNTQNCSAIQTAIDIKKDESIIKVHFQICKMLKASIAEFKVFNSTFRMELKYTLQNYAQTAFGQSVGFPKPLCLFSLIHLSENHSTNLQTWQIRNCKGKTNFSRKTNENGLSKPTFSSTDFLAI